MTSGVPAITVGLVKETEHVRMGLEIELGADPIRGRVVTESGEVLAFEGWLQMAALLGTYLPTSTHQSTSEASS